MAGTLLTDLITVRATAGAVTSVTQDSARWLLLEDASDAAFWFEVADVTSPGVSVSLHVESAPTEDEALFADACPPIVLAASSTPFVRKTVRTPSTKALGNIVRWRLDVPGGSSGLWSATFRIRVVPLRSRSFVPTDIAGCQMWVRSDLGLTFNGSAVTAWADQSGNGRDLSQGTAANQPGYTAASINNLPSINFDGSNDVLFTSSAFSLGTYTVLLVTTGQDGTNGWFWTREPASHVVSDTLYGTTGSTMYSTRAGNTSGWDLTTSWGQWGATTAKLLVTQMDGTHAGHFTRLNGVTQTPSSGAGVDPGTLSTTDMFTLGARSDAVLPSKIKVAEVIVYDHALDAADLARVEQYLRRRYALY